MLHLVTKLGQEVVHPVEVGNERGEALYVVLDGFPSEKFAHFWRGEGEV
jgi:hypothetical protein